jgi:hypothetical protein
MDASIQGRVHRADLAPCDGGCDGSDPGSRSADRRVRIASDGVGPSPAPHFTHYHRVLNRNKWSTRWLSCRLFGLLVMAFVPSDEPVVIEDRASVVS